MTRSLFVAWLAAALGAAADAGALSLRSARAEAFLGDARPGSRLSYSRALGAPFGVENAGSEPALVELSFSQPPPEGLADGYEPLPDPGWARAAPERHALEAGRTGRSELVLSLPRDQGLEGRQFQLDCLVSGRARDGTRLRLRTRLLLAVGEEDPPPREPAPESWRFAVLPRRVALEGVALGRPRGFAGLKLANAGEEAVRARVRTVRNWPEELSPPPGYALAPNPRWLATGPPVAVPAGAVRTAELRVSIPDEPRYRGRRFAFLVAVDAEKRGRVGRSWTVIGVATAP